MEVCPGHSCCCVHGAVKLGAGSRGLCSTNVSFEYGFKGCLLRLHIVNDLGSLVFMLKVSLFSVYAINISLKPCHFPEGLWFQNNFSAAQEENKKGCLCFPII